MSGHTFSVTNQSIIYADISFHTEKNWDRNIQNAKNENLFESHQKSLLLIKMTDVNSKSEMNLQQNISAGINK